MSNIFRAECSIKADKPFMDHTLQIPEGDTHRANWPYNLQCPKNNILAQRIWLQFSAIVWNLKFVLHCTVGCSDIYSNYMVWPKMENNLYLLTCAMCYLAYLSIGLHLVVYIFRHSLQFWVCRKLLNRLPFLGYVLYLNCQK